MRDIRAHCGEGGPKRLLFVHMGSVEEGEKFFADFWPDAPAAADEDLVVYRAFGRENGGLAAFLAPKVWAASLRALLKRNFVGRPVGDVRVMPGMFIVENGCIIDAYEPRDVSDHGPIEAFLERVDR